MYIYDTDNNDNNKVFRFKVLKSFLTVLLVSSDFDCCYLVEYS